MAFSEVGQMDGILKNNTLSGCRSVSHRDTGFSMKQTVFLKSNIPLASLHKMIKSSPLSRSGWDRYIGDAVAVSCPD